MCELERNFGNLLAHCFLLLSAKWCENEPWNWKPVWLWETKAWRGWFNVICQIWKYRGYYMPAHGYEFYLRVFNSIFEHENIKFISTSGHVIFCLLYRHQWNTRKTISWTNPFSAESCMIKYRSYAHSYFSREIEKISSVYLYSDCYSNKAHKILLKRCVIVL